MRHKLLAEGLGTALLLIAVVGSGITGETLAGGNIAIALLANAIATGCMLYVIITVFAPFSGAHFNPIVTLAFAWRKELPVSTALSYIAVQIVGGILGVWLTHVVFDQSVFQLSTTSRASFGLYVSESMATFGLLLVIFGTLKSSPTSVPTAVALYITGAYWFTSSTSFANPAATIARSVTDTFSGIDPTHAPMFIAMQVLGLLYAIGATHALRAKAS